MLISSKLNTCILTWILMCLLLSHFVNNGKCDKAWESDKSTSLVFVGKDADDGNSLEDGVSISDDVDDGDNMEMTNNVFVATEEWQVVKEGQAIPAGLHIQMDFQTGIKRAKLLAQTSNQEDNQKSENNGIKKTTKKKKKVKQTSNNGHGMTSWDAGGKLGFINTAKKRYTREELKQTLKDFKYADLTPKEKSEKEFKKEFRSYEDLKKVLKDSRMAVKTEAEIVTDLLQKLKHPQISTNEAVIVLTDLEYYFHQIDNGQLLATQGGLDLLKDLLNGSDPDLRAGAAHCLGAAWQSNAQVQVAAVDSGLLQQLVLTLSLEDTPTVHKKALFALATLLRQFPFAQAKFLDAGGLSVLADIFKKTNDENLQIKIITLLTDLLLEYDFNTNQNDSVQEERTLQYKRMKLRGAMVSNGWCSLMSSLLYPMSGHDHVEKLITAMMALAETCRQDFHRAAPTLQTLMTQYRELAQGEDPGDDFFNSIYTSLQTLVTQIARDEL